MALRLKICLIIIMLFFLGYVLKKVRHDKLAIKNALIWIISDILVIFCIIFIENLLMITNIIGIETVSNMIFFIGFIFLLILCFNQTCQLSTQNKKIIILTQELGILKNKIDKDKRND